MLKGKNNPVMGFVAWFWIAALFFLMPGIERESQKCPQMASHPQITPAFKTRSPALLI